MDDLPLYCTVRNEFLMKVISLIYVPRLIALTRHINFYFDVHILTTSIELKALNN